MACRGTVAVMFAVSIIAIVVAVGAAIDMSRLADARASLQRAVDNAALSGAAVYTLNSSSYQTKAVVSATSSFCDAVSTIAAGFSVVANTTSYGTSQTCNASAGPNVYTTVGGYQTGTPATYSNVSGSGCTVTNNVIAGETCGFVVFVSGSATMNSLFPAIFGTTKTIRVTGIAINPFINLPSVLRTSLSGTAKNTNSIWVYPLLLDANGNPDFTSNAGALPNYGCSGSAPTCADASPLVSSTNADGNACDDSPLTFVCGNYVMLASTYYYGCMSVCTVNGTQFLNGVVQNPPAPPAVITATTPIGFAMESVAGGTVGYNTWTAALLPPNGCVIPQGEVYGGTTQVYSNSSNTEAYGTNPMPTPALDWHLVTRWFYSSYLANNLPPSYGEILSQNSGSNNLVYPSVGVGQITNSFLPSNAACALFTTNTRSQLTTFPGTVSTAATAYDNLSLFILENNEAAPSATGYAAPSYYAGQNFGNQYSYTPSGTPGYQYAALSCQSYGSNEFTFYWNDMGGQSSYGDDRDYNNGSVYVTCASNSFVQLIG